MLSNYEIGGEQVVEEEQEKEDGTEEKES